MKLKRFYVFGLIVLMGLLLVACGGSDPGVDPGKHDGPVETKYNITFKDEEGNTLNTQTVEANVVPTYTYNKADTVEWDYTVEGWSTTQGGEKVTIPAAKADATYYAVVTKEKQKYTVTFNCDGGSSVEAITQEYGTDVSEPAAYPSKQGFKFMGWTTDASHNTPVTWPINLKGNVTVYAAFNETIDIKAYLKTMIEGMKVTPDTYIPESMRATNSKNFVTQESVTYNFNNDTQVSSIKYGGFGEQWHMVIDNINESNRYFKVLSLVETALNSSVSAFNNYLDKNPSTTADHTIEESIYTASIEYKNSVLKYTLQLKTGYEIPLFGQVTPLINMTYNVETNEKEVKIVLTANNAIKYIINENKYEFAIEYGIDSVSRKAYCSIEKGSNNTVTGHIYEYIQLKGKEVIASCADFYIDKDYATVVGNKASGMVGFKGYITELYKTSEAKLLGYEVRETLSFAGISGTYNTLWFNLNDINGITSIKAVENSNLGVYGDNNHDIYVNGSSEIFTPTKNKKLVVETSRKYDIELRKQYFYNMVNGELVEYEVSVPMMFIQADNDKDTNYSDFSKDILAKSGITASVNLNTTYLAKIQSDYAKYIDILISNKDKYSADAIKSFIEE